MSMVRVDSFAPSQRHRICTPRPKLQASQNPNDIFETQGWRVSIKKELDQVPVFAVANEEGRPIKNTMESRGTSFKVPVFYTHVEDAMKELDKAKEINPQPGMDINPYPLGDIFKMWATNEAVIVPNKRSIIQAGAPPNANPMGQKVPLFACMDIANEGVDGIPVLPLFFELDDANQAVSEAVGADGGKEVPPEVVRLNLNEAVSLLSNSDESAFVFIPPSSSLEHIRGYLSG